MAGRANVVVGITYDLYICHCTSVRLEELPESVQAVANRPFVRFWNPLVALASLAFPPAPPTSPCILPPYLPWPPPSFWPQRSSASLSSSRLSGLYLTVSCQSLDQDRDAMRRRRRLHVSCLPQRLVAVQLSLQLVRRQRQRGALALPSGRPLVHRMQADALRQGKLGWPWIFCRLTLASVTSAARKATPRILPAATYTNRWCGPSLCLDTMT
jgi:hypothetical protein